MAHLPFLPKNLDGLSWRNGALRPSRVAALDAPRSTRRKKSTQNLVGSFQKSGPDDCCWHPVRADQRDNGAGEGWVVTGDGVKLTHLAPDPLAAGKQAVLLVAWCEMGVSCFGRSRISS